MLRNKPLVVLAALGLQTVAATQSPPLLVMPGGAQIVSTGAPLNFNISGQAGAPYALFVDIAGGPVDLFGERFYLGFTSNLASPVTSVLPATGQATYATGLPPFLGLGGLVIHGQVVALDPAASNGLFRVSNAASTGCYAGGSQIVETFHAALPAGYTGTFSQDVPGQVRGGPITTRTVDTIPLPTNAIPSPIASPLQPLGCRQQVVYRASDLGASGEPEVITGMRWRTLLAPVTDAFPQFTIRLGHTDVTPNYAIDPWSALPAFPNSGLSATFADNELAGAPPSVVYSGPYSILPSQQMPGAFMPYPMTSAFEYDGQSSLLIDFRVPQSSALGVNGMAMNLMVQSSPLPGTRVVAFGTAGNPVDPNTVATGTPDCAMPVFQFELQRTTTFLQSPWLDSGSASPDYDQAIIGKSLPTGTSIEVQFRGSSLPNGGNPTGWSNDPSIADSKQHLQYRITFRSNYLTGERPLVDTLVVPIL